LIASLHTDSINEHRTVRGKYLSICGGSSTTKLSIQRIEAGSEKKMMLPFQLKKPSIVVPDPPTTEKLGEEKTDKSANKWPLIKEKLQPRCHIHYYFDLSRCDARYSARKRHSVLDIFEVCYPPHQALNAKPKAAMWYRAIIS
jgi:hypothetical protein